MPAASTRLYVILARKAPYGVIFRRGPSRQVALLGWDTDRHQFRVGQWFKGRIYERRCDLSPSGEKLVYFAAKHKAPHYSWTVVSRPPFLAALALWPKGDCWGGGGLFRNERALLLNHRRLERKLAPDCRLPRAISVEPLGKLAGGGEDEPILGQRLARDGWQCLAAGRFRHSKIGDGGMRIVFDEPQIWRKVRGPWELQMLLRGHMEDGGPSYLLDHRVVDARGEPVLAMSRSDWADWSRSGELLFARDGRLYRVGIDEQLGPREPEELIDLRSLKFEQLEPPEEALRWSGRGSRGRLVGQAAISNRGPKGQR